jgi:hypothetical protein
MTKREPIKVILPDHRPALTPQAARAVLRILLDAQASGDATQSADDEDRSHRPAVGEVTWNSPVMYTSRGELGTLRALSSPGGPASS